MTRKGPITVVILHREESYAIMGACFEVYREVGCGFVEPVYQKSLQIEFSLRDISHVPQPELKLAYIKTAA